MINYRQDEGEIAANNLLDQHTRKPDTMAFTKSLFKPLTRLGVAFAELTELRWIDSAQGVQLDGIGDIVGIARDIPQSVFLPFFGYEGQPAGRAYGVARYRSEYEEYATSYKASDEEYRTMIKAKIIANSSHGLREDIIRSLTEVLEARAVEITNLGNANVRARVWKTYDDNIPIFQLIDKLIQPAAGVNLTFDYQPDEISFVDFDVLDSRGTFVRPSLATWLDSTGALTEYAAASPRLPNNGLYMERSRTNAIRNPRMEGAIVSASSNPTATNWKFSLGNGLIMRLIEAATVAGMPTITLRCTGTPTAGNAGLIIEPDANTGKVLAVSAGDRVAFSCHMKVVRGNGDQATRIYVRHRYFNAAGVAISQNDVQIITAKNAIGLGRFTSIDVAPASAAYYSPIVYIQHLNQTTALDFDLMIGGFQIEKGGFATSLILPTPGNPVAYTREAEYITGALSDWFNKAQGTLFARYKPINLGSQISKVFSILSSGTEEISIVTGESGKDGFTYVNPSTATIQAYRGWDFSQAESIIAVAFSGNRLVGAKNGILSPTFEIGDLPTNFSKFIIGNSFSGSIENLSYYPHAFTDSELIAATRL